MASKLEHALSLAARGFRVFPVQPNAKAPPLLNDWPHKASSDPETIKTYWAAIPDANIAIECSGMIVVDVDVKHGGDESLKLLEQQHGTLASLTAQTPSGGRHIFLRHDDGAANTVGALGAGLDIRSRGGYVVAVGSTVDNAPYLWRDNRDIAPAPEWLVQKLGTFTKPERTEKVNVPDAPDDTFTAASTWLFNQPVAFEGQGGDAHTFKMACGLRDRGVSQSQANALMQQWNEFCAPPWDVDELLTKIANAYRYAQNEPGVKTALPSDFPVSNIKDTKPATSPLQRTRRGHRLGQGAANTAPYLIKGTLSQRSYALMYGAPGAGKSFCALDISYHVAAGLPWMGRKTRQGPVVYVPFEGEGGLQKREQALLQKYGKTQVPLFVLPGVYNLRTPDGARQFSTDVSDIVATEFGGKPPILFVLDTLAHALQGGDENSAQDVGGFNTAVQNLIAATGACVLVLHHSGKNKAAGARGSSALLGAIDTELGVDGFQITASKQRDLEGGEPIGFKLVPATVGMDEDGDILQSCVVEPAAIETVTPGGRLTGNQKRGFDVLCDMSPNNVPIADYKWKEACKAFLEGKNVAARFHDIKRNLVAKGFVVPDDKGNVTRRME